jgi:hypothetical protein
LGATGVVGQQFVARLARHPWFRPSWLAASERSEDKAYAAAAPWRLATPIPDELAGTTVEPCMPGRGPRVVFSALDASVAGDIEQRLPPPDILSSVTRAITAWIRASRTHPQGDAREIRRPRAQYRAGRGWRSHSERRAHGGGWDVGLNRET